MDRDERLDLQHVGHGLEARALAADLVESLELEQAPLEIVDLGGHPPAIDSRAASSLSNIGAYCDSPIIWKIFW